MGLDPCSAYPGVVRYREDLWWGAASGLRSLQCIPWVGLVMGMVPCEDLVWETASGLRSLQCIPWGCPVMGVRSWVSDTV